MIIGITGTIASGKTTVAEILKEKGFVHHTYSDILRIEAKKRSIPQTRENLQKLGNRIKAESKDLGILSRLIIENSSSKNIIADGIRTIDKPFAVSATEQGGQTIYVWLEDSAGNKDFNNNDSTILYWDATAPSGSILINNGSETTYSLIVTLNLSAKDHMSGMGSGAKMRFKNIT